MNILCKYYNDYKLAYYNKIYFEMQKNVKKIDLQQFFNKYRLIIYYK